MKIKRYKSSEERQILTAMIVHGGVLSRIFRHIGQEPKPFGNRWCNLIARWCLDYYGKYHKAPGSAIESLLREHAQAVRDDEITEALEKFLSSLNREYKALAQEINEDYTVDIASKLFEKIRLRRMCEQVESNLESNDVEAARVARDSCERINFASSDWIDPFQEEFISRSLQREERTRLISYPGAMGVFLSPHLTRKAFVAFAGPAKRGKSYWLLDVVWRAILQKRRVLYYVLGDMGEDEVGERLLIRAARHPITPMEIRKPKSIIGRQTGKPKTKGIRKKFKTGLNVEQAKLAMDDVLRRTATSESRLALKVDGGYVVSASDIERDVQERARSGWAPDVVVVDYADLLAPEPQTKGQDLRNQINLTWAILRRIALQNHLLMVVATQTATSSYSRQWVIRKEDFSEDRRKNDHVTGMIGINQSDHEKEQQIYRLNWIALRGGNWSSSRVVWAGGCLDIANPCLASII